MNWNRHILLDPDVEGDKAGGNSGGSESSETVTKTPEVTGDKLYSLKINGNDVQVTQEELIKMAQKGESADQRFREASDLTKQNERQAQVMQDMKDANAGDIAALERLGTYPELGITPDQIANAKAKLTA